MSYSLNALYKEVGVTKQSVDQYAKRQAKLTSQIEQLIIEVDELREAHPGCGVEKMYYTLQPSFIGRDRFVDLMMQLGYRLKKRRNYRRTTHSGAYYYPNLIDGLLVKAPLSIWQSDITYYRVGDQFYYVVFILDVYTKIIVGYRVSDHMRASANVWALQSALDQYGAPAIHHSDRGSQYIYEGYVDLLQRHHVQISMGLMPQQNAYAERINRTIKEEYLDHWKPQNLNQLKRMTAKAVKHYNECRPHNHLNKQKPSAFAQYWAKADAQHRPSITIFDHHSSHQSGQH